MSDQHILVAGIGNIFLGDDAFGVEIAQRLAQETLPPQVRVVDFGIRGIDLMYALLDNYQAVILVDAVPRGGVPGTLYVIEPEFDHDALPAPAEPLIDMHDLDPGKVLHAAAALGAQLKRVYLVGCEPQMVDEVEGALGLSAPVRAAVDQAVSLVQDLIEKLCAAGLADPAIDRPAGPACNSPVREGQDKGM